MSATSGKFAWMALWVLLAVGAGLGLIFLMGQKPIPPAPPVIAATLPAPAQTAPAATQPPVVIRNYGQLLSAELRNYPSTQPWAVPVELPDAAHIILHDPVYVCSRGDLWITRPDADPLATVLARAGDESEHLVDRRIFPSINVEVSGTRKEELLYHPEEYNKVVILRRALTGVPPVEAMELLLGKLKKTRSNIEFLLGMAV